MYLVVAGLEPAIVVTGTLHARPWDETANIPQREATRVILSRTDTKNGFAKN